jgi:argininosuccinate lyase
MPFRDAHEVVAQAVKLGVQQGCDLADLPLTELQKFSSMITSDAYQVLTLEGSIASRNHIGGTAPAQVKLAIARARQALS